MVGLSLRRYSQQAYYVRATSKREQLAEVLGAFGIQVEEGDLLSRCARCNGTFVPRCRPACNPSASVGRRLWCADRL